MRLFGYGSQAISPVSPDRSYFDRLFIGLLNPHTPMTIDIFWLLHETPKLVQKLKKRTIFLKMRLFGYSEVSPDRSYFDPPFIGLLKPHTPNTMDYFLAFAFSGFFMRLQSWSKN